MRIFVVAVALALLGACGSNPLESKVDYKSAGKLPPLDIPPDLTAPSRDNRYQVPEGGRGTTTLSGYQADRAHQPKTGSTSLLPAAEGMRVERDRDQRWLVVNEPPEKIWPQVKEFWQESGFLISLELPEAGVIETDWAENRAKIPKDLVRRALGFFLDSVYSTDERDKYRTRLERARRAAAPRFTSATAACRRCTSARSARRQGGSRGPPTSSWKSNSCAG